MPLDAKRKHYVSMLTLLDNIHVKKMEDSYNPVKKNDCIKPIKQLKKLTRMFF